MVQRIGVFNSLNLKVEHHKELFYEFVSHKGALLVIYREGGFGFPLDWFGEFVYNFEEFLGQFILCLRLITLIKAFKIAYLQRRLNSFNLIRALFHKYFIDPQRQNFLFQGAYHFNQLLDGHTSHELIVYSLIWLVLNYISIDSFDVDWVGAGKFLAKWFHDFVA